MSKVIRFGTVLFLVLATAVSCSSGDKEIELPDIKIKLEDTGVKFGYKTATRNIVVESPFAWTASSDKEDEWCHVTSNTSAGFLTLRVDDNDTFYDRTAVITVMGGGITKTFKVEQDIVTEYTPGDTGGLDDSKVQVRFTDVSVTPYLVKGPLYLPENMIDGKTGSGSTWHSGRIREPENVLPIDLEFTLEGDADALDYLVIYPNTDGDGKPAAVNVYVTTEEDDIYVLAGEINNSDNSGAPIVFNFTERVLNPRKVKLELKAALPKDPDFYILWIAEVQGFAKLESDLPDNGVFTDGTCSELKTGITLEKINAMADPFLRNIAYFLFTDNYQGKEFRIQEYEAYRPVYDLRDELKTSAYCQFENPTGISFLPGDEAIIFVGDTHGYPVSLRVTNFGNEGGNSYMQSDNMYVLCEGLNKIKITGTGNGYISYFTPDYTNAPDIKIHIASGKAIGYFDIEKHNNDDWARLMKIPGEIIDMKGKRIILSYQRSIMAKNTPSDGVALLKRYDDIVGLQHSMMGLDKHGRTPKNHMFGRMKYDSGNPWADGFGMALPVGTPTDRATNLDMLTRNGWGVYHELGHVNQVRPGFRWKKTVEVTNNLYSMWCQYHFDPASQRVEFDVVDAGDGLGQVIGGRINKSLRNVVYNDAGVWIDFDDVFCPLVPLWQLHLYYQLAVGKDAYADFLEIIRTMPNVDDNGRNQANFVKYFCDAVKEDLTDFFIEYKILIPFDVATDDAGKERVIITESMVNEVKDYIASRNYQKPNSKAIRYITSRTVDIYKNKLTLSNAQMGSGITFSGGTAVVSNEVWKNAVGFEARKGDKVIAASASYAGYEYTNRKNTKLAFPATADNIAAVSWDGTRKIIYQK